MRALLTATTLTIVIAFAPSIAAGASIGLKDTVQDGAADGWFAGGGPWRWRPSGMHRRKSVQRADPRVPVTSSFRSARSNGIAGTAGSRLVALNLAQWADDYLGAGGH